jgi:hypothetical protein
MNPAKRVAKLRQTIQQIHQGYQSNFAGQPRHSRDPRLLDTWVARLKTLQPQVKVLHPAHKTEIQSLLNDRVSLYQKESLAIKTLSEMSPPSRGVYQLLEWASLSNDRYARHFAGYSRNTRDPEILAELTADTKVWLSQAQEYMETFKEELSEPSQVDLEAHLQTLTDRIALYESELKAIDEAQSKGTAEERSGLYGLLANACFETYRSQFQGHSRLSRRVETLERLISRLEQIQSSMRGLKTAGGDPNLKNLEIVTKNLEGYQQEIIEIEGAQSGMSYDDWITQLNEATDKVMSDYQTHFSGKNRSTCDPNLLRHFCDRLYDIAFQLRPFLQVASTSEQSAQFQRLLDHLRLYHREYHLVKQAIAATADEEKIIH